MAKEHSWRHGWIPLTSAAALAKAKGNHKRAAQLLRKRAEIHGPTPPAKRAPAKKAPTSKVQQHRARTARPAAQTKSSGKRPQPAVYAAAGDRGEDLVRIAEMTADGRVQVTAKKKGSPLTAGEKRLRAHQRKQEQEHKTRRARENAAIDRLMGR